MTTAHRTSSIDRPGTLPTDPAATRTGAALGLTAVALITAGFALLGPTPIFTSPVTESVAFYQQAGMSRVVAAFLVQSIGLLLLLPFVAAVTGRLRGSGAAGLVLPGTARSAATVYVTLALAPSTVSAVAAYWLAQHVSADAGVLMALTTLRSFSYYAALLAWSVALVCIGVSATLGGRLPRWAGWGAIGIGVALAATLPVAASGLTDALALVALLWVVPVAVHLLRRRDADTRG